MGIKINHNGLTNLYAKVKQVNIKNSHMVETDEEGNTTVLDTRPMDVVVAVYDNEEKGNMVDKFAFNNMSCDPTADDKDPVNQAYGLIKDKLDIVEDLV